MGGGGVGVWGGVESSGTHKTRRCCLHSGGMRVRMYCVLDLVNQSLFFIVEKTRYDTPGTKQTISHHAL